MRIKIASLLFLLFAQHAAWAVAKIEHWQTAQGSRVFYVQTQNLPMVDIRVTFDAGSARDGERYGLAALTLATLATGADQWNADDIAKRFEDVGAHFGTDANEDMAWLSLRSLTDPNLLERALATLQALLAKPTFSETDFQREKSRTLAALKHREESPAELASLAFHKALYGDHPYAHPTEGMLETVAGLTTEDLRSFYRRYYVAANANVVIVGDVDRPTAERIVERLTQDLAKGEKPAVIVETTMPTQGSERHIEFPSTQTHVLAGMPGSYRKDPDYFPLYVGNHILGGSGLVSVLSDEVREKRGLAYTAASYFAPMFRQGPFTMTLQTRNDQTGQALDVMKQTLADFVGRGPSDEQLAAAKKNITGGFALRLDSNSKLTEYVNMIGFYQQPLDYLDTFQQKVEAVGVADIKDAFQRRVRPELLQIITVGAK